MNTRIVFMGSPDFAIPSLVKLSEGYSIIGVVTQPDRHAGRGRILTPPPVKEKADQLGIPTIQPDQLHSDLDAKKIIRAWRPDIIIVAAFGQILREDVLNIAPYGCINVHASLLPRWRGVSPIQAAILHGDQETGVTIMVMDEGIDTGEVIRQRSIPIMPEDTGGSILAKLSYLGADLLIDSLPPYLNNEISTQPQGDSPTPYTKMLKRSDGRLDFKLPAEVLARKVRAYNPWPGTYMVYSEKQLKIHTAYHIHSSSPGIGVRFEHDQYPAVGTANGQLVLHELQLPGKKKMTGKQFLIGAKNWFTKQE